MDRIRDKFPFVLAAIWLAIVGILVPYWPVDDAGAVSVTFTNITTGRKLFYTDWNNNFDTLETAVSQLDSADKTKHTKAAFTAYSGFEKTRNFAKHDKTAFRAYSTYEATIDSSKVNTSAFSSYSSREVTRNFTKKDKSAFTTYSTFEKARNFTKKDKAAFTTYSAFEQTRNFAKKDKTAFTSYSAVNAVNITQREHLQYTDMVYGTYTSVTATIPLDDTPPLYTEGKEVTSMSVTPTVVGSELQVYLDGLAFMPLINKSAISALFVNNTCVSATVYTSTAANKYVPLSTEGDYTTWSLTPVTVALRMGTADGTAIYINGDSSSRVFGGKLTIHVGIRESTQ